MLGVIVYKIRGELGHEKEHDEEIIGRMFGGVIAV